MLSILYMLCIITPDYTQANFTVRSILDQLYTLANSQTEQARYLAKPCEGFGLIIAGFVALNLLRLSGPTIPHISTLRNASCVTTRPRTSRMAIRPWAARRAVARCPSPSGATRKLGVKLTTLGLRINSLGTIRSMRNAGTSTPD